ncbi:hypothetical protein CEXT_512301 [Caerostris extrusa]|uniref:Uncharacterized protein n=1 Tax=Caerostris extrusa TaxID=172846 RepID=A0AAV4TB15_CAEEX|nr:hypothetical protein CEXT_512301 [Caerostris extrusa]
MNNMRVEEGIANPYLTTVLGSNHVHSCDEAAGPWEMCGRKAGLDESFLVVGPCQCKGHAAPSSLATITINGSLQFIIRAQLFFHTFVRVQIFHVSGIRKVCC